MNVKRNTLLLLACFVWIAAGFNIFRIGFIEYKPYHNIINYLLSILVFVVFQIFIFAKLVKKHTERIGNYTEEKHLFIKFFMMTLGIVLRYGGLAPKRFIAVFYAGLGASLLLAGLKFGYNFIRAEFNILK